ncbi:MAG: DsrE family protein [Candidatus Marinimicrobia bacterium]|jgi:hypothetical protein|nr:hypothetical protein [Candidatus Neomarinimicrobiota bacterium]MDP6456800.1 DsrE family protein [Candidatus Neomarinimicrobiota bacterium]MDP6593539.1 DsrE family protein [Candidatus Neomarinimicrobiota bacterium]MDP6837226.1 DsrE family protein [Candidatus Neomarinimicrobiota bacterium]MDP6967035.1 DsrE family protein [Candidatus Neomarinimicrobiota bacterium]|tara:strand:- start:3101 stop:3370 length:270 start_codon:yes stop_codon:yes gene_type:complete
MITFILNHAPYGAEKSYNALRLALALLKKKEPLRIFMLDDGGISLGQAVACLLQYLRNELPHTGLHWMGNLVEPNQLMKDMEMMGLEIT